MLNSSNEWSSSFFGFYMDIERFAPNSYTTVPGAIAPQPTTIEMTGFSDRRCYLEQQTGLRRCPVEDSGIWGSPLDN